LDSGKYEARLVEWTPDFSTTRIRWNCQTPLLLRQPYSDFQGETTIRVLGDHTDAFNERLGEDASTSGRDAHALMRSLRPETPIESPSA